MEFKERLEKVKLYYEVEEKLETKSEELESVERKLKNKKRELEQISDNISKKKSELELLKIEVIELKDFIDEEFKEEFEKSDYYVNITNCYIIGLHGKKYIAFKNHSTKRGEFFDVATGYYYIEQYEYYDVLNVEEHQYKLIHEYSYGHYEHGYFQPKTFGEKPDYEEHILEVYPELSRFVNNNVPNTYLKKIYFEINDLGNKKLVK